MTVLRSEREIITEHIVRNYLTTDDHLGRLEFPDRGLKAVRRMTGALVVEGWLKKRHLDLTHKYYQLSYRAVRKLKENKRLAEPLGVKGLLNAVGVLAFSANCGVRRFTFREFSAQYPELYRPGLPASNYYVDQEGDAHRIGFIQVDYGNPPRAILKKVRRTIAHRHAIDAFRQLITAGGFVVTVVTSTPGKKADIEEVLRDERGEVRFRVEVAEELAPLLIRRV